MFRITGIKNIKNNNKNAAFLRHCHCNPPIGSENYLLLGRPLSGRDEYVST